MQLELNIARGASHWRVIPLVFLYVIVFAVAELDLFKAIIASEGVDLALEVNCCKESLFLEHIFLDLDSHIVVMQVVVCISISAN